MELRTGHVPTLRDRGEGAAMLAAGQAITGDRRGLDVYEVGIGLRGNAIGQR